MKSLLVARPFLVLAIVGIGLLAMTTYDGIIAWSEASRRDGEESLGLEQYVQKSFYVFVGPTLLVLPLRVFMYVALFISFPIVARELSHANRCIKLAGAWCASGAVIAGILWIQFVQGNLVLNDSALKRFNPDPTQHFPFEPNWSKAEVALGKDAAATYTWQGAIFAEAIALVVVCAVVAAFLGFVRWTSRSWLAYFAPATSLLVLFIYTTVVPWAFVWDWDIFIGDALLGAAFFNSAWLHGTLIWGNLLAPNFWVACILAANILFAQRWRNAE